MIFHYADLHLIDEKAEEIQSFLSWINDTEGPINILLDSQGGHMHIGLFVMNALNFHKDRLILTAGILQSTGMLLWLGYEGRVETQLLSQGMIHSASMHTEIREGGRAPASRGQANDELIRRLGWISDNYYVPILEPAQLSAFRHNHDIWLGPEAMSRIAAEKNSKR